MVRVFRVIPLATMPFPPSAGGWYHCDHFHDQQLHLGGVSSPLTAASLLLYHLLQDNFWHLQGNTASVRRNAINDTS